MHGDADPTVNVAGSRAMVAKLKELGTDFKYIEVPGGLHSDVVAPNLAGGDRLLRRAQEGGEEHVAAVITTINAETAETAENRQKSRRSRWHAMREGAVREQPTRVLGETHFSELRAEIACAPAAGARSRPPARGACQVNGAVSSCLP